MAPGSFSASASSRGSYAASSSSSSTSPSTSWATLLRVRGAGQAPGGGRRRREVPRASRWKGRRFESLSHRLGGSRQKPLLLLFLRQGLYHLKGRQEHTLGSNLVSCHLAEGHEVLGKTKLKDTCFSQSDFSILNTQSFSHMRFVVTSNLSVTGSANLDQ